MQPGVPKRNESCHTANPLYNEGGTITTARRAVKKWLGKVFRGSGGVDSRDNCCSG